MVEEWKVGDRFEVIENRSSGYLKKGDEGICYGIANKGEETIYLNPEKNEAIHIYRLKKVNSNIEIW